jgi:hypothetical protein
VNEGAKLVKLVAGLINNNGDEGIELFSSSACAL